MNLSLNLVLTENLSVLEVRNFKIKFLSAVFQPVCVAFILTDDINLIQTLAKIVYLTMGFSELQLYIARSHI